MTLARKAESSFLYGGVRLTLGFGAESCYTELESVGMCWCRVAR